ncbi:predicted protein [Histoplasma mississippiense (nom. inval.)]|uniref:predicted protein n=1 Tax=Ajellomyces capsulatus (strain NAm1 / WU24) TaxID=2059318 RepID=UPI000157D304|nr:predicted protein [Histoplasma mississippiense (nom. inval.)]EDN04468.1 predicted protein [Histoplasma mississippiense (nom. inval.)]
MATFTYNITSPGPADGSPSPQLHTVRLLEAYTPDPWSDEEPQHLLAMPMPVPVPLFSASGDLSKNAANDVSPPSLQLSDFSDDPIEEAQPSPSDVADDPPNRREPTLPALDDREGNTSKEPLNYSDDSIEASPRPGEERHIQAHQSEQVTPLVSDCWEGDALGETLDKQEYIILPLSQVKILKLVYKRDGDEMYQIVGWIDLQETRGYGTQRKPWKYSGSAERVPEGYEIYAKMTLDDLQEHGGLELLAAYYSWNNKCRRTRSCGLRQH